MRRLAQTIDFVRAPLMTLLVLHAILPAKAFGWLPRFSSWLLRGAHRFLGSSPLARLSLLRHLRVPPARLACAHQFATTLGERFVVLAEVAHGLACLAFVPAIAISVHRTVMRLGNGPVHAFCPSQDQAKFSPDSLCGDPHTISRAFLALILVYAGIAIDRSAVVFAPINSQQFMHLSRVGPVIEGFTLLLLLSEASPLSIPFAVHTSVDSFLKRLVCSSQRASRPQLAQAAGNARAFAGAVMSLCVLASAAASAQPWCGGKQELASIVIASRLLSLLADVIDVARRMHYQHRQMNKLHHT